MNPNIWPVMAVGLVFFISGCGKPESANRGLGDGASLFKYGSLGVEAEKGIPRYIWEVLPELFPEYLPDSGKSGRGYAAFGFVFETGKALPIGLSERRLSGVSRLGVNCALCHTGTYRNREGERQLLLGGVSHQLDIQAYLRFLTHCARDERFTGHLIARAIERKRKLKFWEKLLYRHLVVKKVKKKLLQKAEEDAYQFAQPDYGPGRAGLALIGLPIGLPIEKTRPKGGYDFMPLWNAAAHEGQPVHWDAFSKSRINVFYSASASMGATKKNLDENILLKVKAWLDELPPPKYPWAIDDKLADDGQFLYQKNCAGCHAFDGSRAGQPVPYREIGTDRHRMDSWPAEAPAALEAWGENEGYPDGLKGFQKVEGYKAPPLDGIWARSPYLHNGSVPTLRDLLKKPDLRPKVFYRGNDAFDTVRVGFVSNVVANKHRRYFPFKTSDMGNGNGGHLFGTDLGPKEKLALLEYLKTL